MNPSLSSSPPFHAEMARLRHQLAGLRVSVSLMRLGLALRSYHDQPRIPAGNPDGGQWTDGGGGYRDGRVRVAQVGGGRSGGISRFGGQWSNATLGQQARLAASNFEANAAMAHVRRFDPTWRPQPSIGEGIEGAIAHNQYIVRQAEARLARLRLGEPLAPTTEDVLANAGRREGRARPHVRTMDEDTFGRTVQTLVYPSQKVAGPADYEGVCYARPDGSVVGLRMSLRHGITLDILKSTSSVINRGYRVHMK